MIIGINSNTHNVAWGHKNNKRGDELLEYIIEEGLTLENKGKEFTFDSSIGKTVIDLTLTWKLKSSINQWKVSKELNHSDHNTIKFGIETSTTRIPEHRPWANADWVRFKEELHNKKIRMPGKITARRLDTMLDHYYKQIEDVINVACPLQPKP